jgi:hypothetical protein
MNVIGVGMDNKTYMNMIGVRVDEMIMLWDGAYYVN